MPVSHIGLTVSHLPSSTSFFLSALQPLSYRYIGESGGQVGFGIRDADFFLCQETPEVKAGAAHIAFSAPSRTAVRNFYTEALSAGGRPNGAPATRCDEDGRFNAAVLDLDGNSIEVVFKNAPDVRHDGTVIEHSRVITWQRSVYESYHNDRSVASSRTTSSRPVEHEVISKAPSAISHAPSVASRGGSIARSFSAPVTVPQTITTSDAGDGAAKKIIGTLLGAAAGAAVAYAMVRSEQDSAKKEADFSVLMEAKNTVKAAMGLYTQATSQPKQLAEDSQPINEPAHPTPNPVYREIDVESYHSSTPSRSRSAQVPRQIEAASPSYYSPSHVSVRKAATREIECAPADLVAPLQARSRHTVARSVTSPEILMIEKARSVAPSAKPHSVLSVPKTRSVTHSVAPSTLISSFVPDQVPRRVSEGNVHSSRSKARSSHTHTSGHTSHSKHRRSRRSEASESSPSPPPYTSKAPSKAASIVSSILGRDAKSSISKHEDFIDDLEIEELIEDDADTVAPSDSISNAGSSSRRRHRRKHGDGSVVSSTSRHSHRSHRSHKPHSHHSSDEASENRSKSRRSTVISEPSDATTVKPRKRESSRKDSLMNGQYEGLYDEANGKGSVATMPIRGITPSMLSAARKNDTRTMVHWGMAQKARAFEGQS